MERYYDPVMGVEKIDGLHNLTGCSKCSEMPASAQEWFLRAAKTGYEWKCLNGKWPEEVPTPEVSAIEKQKQASIFIDHAAGEARKRIVSDSSLIEIEYLHTYDAAVQFINAGYTGDTPTAIKSHSEAYGVTDKQSADDIKAIGDNWFKTLDIIRDIRLKGKKAIENAGDDSDFEAIAQPFIDQLNAINPELTA